MYICMGTYISSNKIKEAVNIIVLAIYLSHPTYSFNQKCKQYYIAIYVAIYYMYDS